MASSRFSAAVDVWRLTPEGSLWVVEANCPPAGMPSGWRAGILVMPVCVRLKGGLLRGAVQHLPHTYEKRPGVAGFASKETYGYHFNAILAAA